MPAEKGGSVLRRSDKRPIDGSSHGSVVAEIEVIPGVFFAGKDKKVRALMRSREQPCKVFAGYAGWASGQLEQEVQDGVWRAVPATAERIFASDDNLWEELLRQAFDVLLQSICRIKQLPSDASLN